MFPIRDHNPSGRTPFVTYALIAANVLIFLGYFTLFQDNRAINAFFNSYGMFPGRISSGAEYQTLITSMFLHGGWMHLAGNMLFLWIYGDNMEDEMGHMPFLGFYILAGIAAGLIHVASAPSSMVPTVGASGAIAGVMGGYLLLFPRAKVDIFVFLVVFVRVIPIPAFIVLLLWFGMQFVGGIGADPDTGGVAYWAHAGGFVAGFLMTLPLWLRRGATQFWIRTDYHPPHPEARYDYVTSRIPKISRK
ncbi:MAG: rhomboid family intramembrane serine protease [Paracoccaceae bacterium]